MSYLPFNDKLSLYTQKTVAWVTMPLWYYGCLGYMCCIRGYRIKNLKKIREEFKTLLANQRNPMLICANHLTKIDSLIILWALGSICTYFKNFKAYTWNLPEEDRFKNNPFFRFICYLGCCIPIKRGGTREQINRSMSKIKYLLNTNHLAMIFPEGKRSITGRIDSKEFTYGVGKLVNSIQNCEVLCIYARGKFQTEKSNFPQKNEIFSLSMKKISPKSESKGLKATREISTQIIQTLIEMENKYFVSHR